MWQPVVSVIMPAYNAARYIGESIDSVVGQSVPNWELLIVDDGSSDDTPGIIQQYLKKDKRIRYIFKERSGQGKARNNAIRMASSPLVAMIDADDCWYEDKLRLGIDCLNRFHADLVFTDMVLMDEFGYVVRNSFGETGISLQGKAGLKHLLHRNIIGTSTVIARKSAISDSGGFDEQLGGHYGEDYALWLRMLHNGAVFKGMKDILTKHRLHGQQSTREKKNMIAVLKVLAGFDFRDNDLKKAQQSALISHFEKFIKSNPELDVAGFKEAVVYYPGKYQRLMLKALRQYAGNAITAKVVSALSLLTS